MSIAQWIMNADSTGPVSIDGRGEPPHDGMYDTADKMNITYEFKIRADTVLLRYFSFLFKPVFSMNHRWAMAQVKNRSRRS